MELFLLRHGDAVTDAPRDELRSLSALGRQQVATVAGACGSQLSAIQKICVSPFLRAQQTFEVALPFLPFGEKLDSDWLVPAANPYQVIDQIYALSMSQNVSSLMLISHQPLLGILLNLLCGFEPGAYRMGTSSLASIEMEIPGVSMGTLRWLKHPDNY